MKETVASGAQNAAETVSDVAKKGKTALLAGGAAAAGLAATVLISQHANKRTRVLGVPMPKRAGGMPDVSNLMPKRGGIRKDTRKLAGKVTKAADRADKLGKRVSSVATSVKQVSETASEASKKA